jgi:predicted transcriptional regulator
MSTTTIRLPADLKARVTAAARQTGTTAHGFMLAAIAEKTEDAELRSAFVAEAEARFAQVAQSGRTIPWEALRRYLEERAAGKDPRRPSARKLAQTR